MKSYRRLALETLGNRELLTSLLAMAGDHAEDTELSDTDSSDIPDDVQEAVVIGTDHAPATEIPQSAAWGYRADNAIVDEVLRSTAGFVVTVTLTDSASPPASMFDLGDVINLAKGNAGDDVITIDLAVIVENALPDKHGAATLDNIAVPNFRGPSGTVVREFDNDPMTAGIQPLDLTIVVSDVQALKTLQPSTVPPRDV